MTKVATVRMPEATRFTISTEAKTLVDISVQGTPIFSQMQIFDAGMNYFATKLKAANAPLSSFLLVLDLPFELPTNWQRHGLRTQFSEGMLKRHAEVVAARQAARQQQAQAQAAPVATATAAPAAAQTDAVPDFADDIPEFLQ